VVLGKRLTGALAVMSLEQLRVEKDLSYSRLKHLTETKEFSAIVDALIVAESARFKAIKAEIVRRENAPQQMTLEDWLNAPQG